MNHEIHLYSAVARSGGGRYPRDECHPLLVLLRQPPDSEHDLDGARAAAEAQGWTDVDITRAGTLPADAARDMDEVMAGHYREAAQDGASLRVYDVVVQPAPGR